MSETFIQISQLSKSFNDKKILKNIKLSLCEKERFALVGENGCGKSTLLKILAGLELFDSGKVQRKKDLTIGYLSQEVTFIGKDQSVRDYLYSSRLKVIESKLTRMEEHLDDPDVLEQWMNLLDDFQLLGGWNQPPLEALLSKFNLEIQLDSLLSTLSSGQKVRVCFLRLLLDAPDVLLLDEPTNHLDKEMIEWLEGVFQNYKGSIVVVSHDRHFLNRACNRLIEVSNCQLNVFGGSYDYYLKEKDNRTNREIRAYENQKKELVQIRSKIRELSFSRRASKCIPDNDKLAYNLRGEGKQKSIKRAIEREERKLEKIMNNRLLKPEYLSISGFDFNDPLLKSGVSIDFFNISKSYGEKKVILSFSDTISVGDRIVIKGPIGCGKTTLLSMIAHKVIPDCGEIRTSGRATIGLLDQELCDISLEETPFDFFMKKFKLDKAVLRIECAKVGLKYEKVMSALFKDLSVGQRKRLFILSLSILKPHILLLDEPTNHLDVNFLEALEDALLRYNGILIAVSHDQTFIEKVATKVWDLE